jgi:hypothetical protein
VYAYLRLRKPKKRTAVKLPFILTSCFSTQIVRVPLLITFFTGACLGQATFELRLYSRGITSVSYAHSLSCCLQILPPPPHPAIPSPTTTTYLNVSGKSSGTYNFPIYCSRHFLSSILDHESTNADLYGFYHRVSPPPPPAANRPCRRTSAFTSDLVRNKGMP